LGQFKEVEERQAAVLETIDNVLRGVDFDTIEAALVPANPVAQEPLNPPKPVMRNSTPPTVRIALPSSAPTSDVKRSGYQESIASVETSRFQTAFSTPTTPTSKSANIPERLPAAKQIPNAVKMEEPPLLRETSGIDVGPPVSGPSIGPRSSQRASDPEMRRPGAEQPSSQHAPRPSPSADSGARNSLKTTSALSPSSIALSQPAGTPTTTTTDPKQLESTSATSTANPSNVPGIHSDKGEQTKEKDPGCRCSIQ
jgi:hypothetical protein